MENLSKLTQEQKEDISQLKGIFAIQDAEAYILLKEAGFNLDNAIHNKVFLDQQIHASQHHNFQARPMDIFAIDLENEDQFQDLSGRKRKRNAGRYENVPFRNMAAQFRKTYIIKKKEKPKPKKIRRNKFSQKVGATSQNIPDQKMEEEVQFQTELQIVLERSTHLTIVSDLSNAFEEMMNDKKLVALHCISFKPSDQLNPQSLRIALDYTKTLYSQKQFVEHFNKVFINYGLDPNHFDFKHYPFMTEFVNPQQDPFTIIVLRLNPTNFKVQVFRKLRMSEIFKISQPETFKPIIEKIRRQSNIIAYNVSAGIAPLTEEERCKIQQDRLIREQQEKDYFQHLIPKSDPSEEIKQEPSPVEQKIDPKQILQQKRAALRQGLPKYEASSIQNAIDLKLRLPNGSNIRLKLPKTQTVNYLFAFVESYDSNNLGFDNESQRNFDILQPFERISLKERKDEQLGQIFQNSEMETLNVKEL